jgi:hypothetical protein
MHPEVLDDLGLHSALVALTERFSEARAADDPSPPVRPDPGLHPDAELVISSRTARSISSRTATATASRPSPTSATTSRSGSASSTWRRLRALSDEIRSVVRDLRCQARRR